MPYVDRYGITITKVSDGVYDVSRNDRSGRITIDTIYQNETLNEAQILFRAIDRYLRVRELRAGDQDPDDYLPAEWLARYQYAYCRFKIAVYAELIAAKQAEIDAARPRDREPLRVERDGMIAKRDAFVAMELELRTAGDA